MSNDKRIYSKILISTLASTIAIGVTTAAAVGVIDANNKLLEQRKVETRTIINELTSLSEEDKNLYFRKLDEIGYTTNDKTPIQNIIVNALKSNATKSINNLTNLSSEQKQELIKKVEQIAKDSNLNQKVNDPRNNNDLSLANQIAKVTQEAKTKDNEILQIKQSATDPTQVKMKQELEAKKTKAINDISGLLHLSTEQKKSFIDRVGAINDPSKASDISIIVDQAKALDKQEEFNKKKADAKKQIESFRYIEQDEKNKYLQTLDQITEVSKINEIDPIVNQARQKEYDEIVKGLEIEPVDNNSLRRDNNDKYLYLKVKTSKENFEKIKDKRLVMEIKKDPNFFLDEPAAPFSSTNATVYYINHKQTNDHVEFEISSVRTYNDNEKGTYKVTQLKLAGHDAKKNVLKGQSNQITI